MRIPIEKQAIKGVRARIPAWLSDPDGVAPCYCGRPLDQGESHVVATGENNLRRWFHPTCWQMMVNTYDEDEWEDEDDEDDEV